MSALTAPPSCTDRHWDEILFVDICHFDPFLLENCFLFVCELIRFISFKTLVNNYVCHKVTKFLTDVKRCKIVVIIVVIVQTLYQSDLTDDYGHHKTRKQI